MFGGWRDKTLHFSENIRKSALELVNQTTAAANVRVSLDERSGLRYGALTAKATFLIRTDGTAEIDSQNPFPLFDKDQETALGILPSDLHPRKDPVFEVILLGAAYAKDKTEISHRMVELVIGNVRRRILVFGDRYWESSEKISSPRPFVRMPMTYEYAFGGSCEAAFDEHTVLDVEDRMNRYGRGFDAEKVAHDLAACFRSPKGFPKITCKRMLPNLENPENLISKFADAPEPCCWATVPLDIGFRMIEAMKVFQRTGTPPELEGARNMVGHRAHPDWIIDVPPPNSIVSMQGMRPDIDIFSFTLPSVRIVADYVLGKRTGFRELAPQLLVLLPEEARFYIIYRTVFTMQADPEMERSFRLRLENGWYMPNS